MLHLYRYMPFDLHGKFFNDIAKCYKKSSDNSFFGNIWDYAKQIQAQQPTRQNNVQNSIKPIKHKRSCSNMVTKMSEKSQ